MSKFITTGEMIDRLKVGEVAETYGGFKVMKHKGGSITWIYDGHDPHNYLKINMVALDFKWRILPKYVSFDEAIKFLKEDKTLIYHINNSYCIEVNNYTNLGIFEDSGVTFKEMILGNWTVKGESK